MTTAFANQFEGKRLLWIDDRVSSHRALIARMEALGVKIAAKETFDEGLTELSNGTFDRVLLDAMLGHESSLPQIPTLLRAAKGALLSICSGFMYQDDLKKEQKTAEEKTGISIGTLEKTTLPDFDEPEEVSAFLRVLFDEDNVSPKATESEIEADVSPIMLPYSQYARLSLEAKMQWLDEAEIIVKEVIERHFKAGYVYLLFCGEEEPALRIDQNSEIPTEEDIIEVARKIGYAPLVIHNVGVVDDIPAACCDQRGLRSYPTLTISALAGETEEVHFDSGASQSLMSYEWYGEKGWIPYTRNPILIRAGEMLLKGVRYTIDPCEIKDGVGVSIKSSFGAFYIINWEDCRLAVRCGPKCKNDWAQVAIGKETCRFRTGLLGRTLPRDELKVQFVTDFETANIRFLGEG